MDAELIARLSRVCHNCGETFGRHKALDNNCPIIEDRRTVGFIEHQYFDEWKEEEANHEK
jgi:hypothetical protein